MLQNKKLIWRNRKYIKIAKQIVNQRWKLRNYAMSLRIETKSSWLKKLRELSTWELGCCFLDSICTTIKVTNLLFLYFSILLLSLMGVFRSSRTLKSDKVLNMVNYSTLPNLIQILLWPYIVRRHRHYLEKRKTNWVFPLPNWSTTMYF